MTPGAQKHFGKKNNDPRSTKKNRQKIMTSGAQKVGKKKITPGAQKNRQKKIINSAAQIYLRFFFKKKSIQCLEIISENQNWKLF